MGMLLPCFQMPPPPLTNACLGPTAVTLPAPGQSRYVSGPFPVTGKVYNGRLPAVVFGPITGNGRDITFSTCFSGNAVWDSLLVLFQTDDPFSLSFCGGSNSTSVAYNNNSEDDRVFPVCQFGPGLSTFTSTLTSGTKYWLPSWARHAWGFHDCLQWSCTTQLNSSSDIFSLAHHPGGCAPIPTNPGMSSSCGPASPQSVSNVKSVVTAFRAGT
ncbi:hypothetical protein HaLaN_17509 [Haematococcus lacustris]|uniref:Uncharacterized protein n=1 Tax=Haematococcus lacustris TaxID=44745 RepID=A0A699ZPM7_HAELA|nr:hypothetical protein HaLaN_17509 [Haematococcus lacustris]